MGEANQKRFHNEKIDFDNDSIKKKYIAGCSAHAGSQILSLLYNIVDPHIHCTHTGYGNHCTRCCGALLSYYNADNRFLQSLWKRWCSGFSIKRGMSDDRAANTIMNTSFTMVCTFAVVFTALCMIFAKPSFNPCLAHLKMLSNTLCHTCSFI